MEKGKSFVRFTFLGKITTFVSTSDSILQIVVFDDHKFGVMFGDRYSCNFMFYFPISVTISVEQYPQLSEQYCLPMCTDVPFAESRVVLHRSFCASQVQLKPCRPYHK